MPAPLENDTAEVNLTITMRIRRSDFHLCSEETQLFYLFSNDYPYQPCFAFI